MYILNLFIGNIPTFYKYPYIFMPNFKRYIGYYSYFDR